MTLQCQGKCSNRIPTTLTPDHAARSNLQVCRCSQRQPCGRPSRTASSAVSVHASLAIPGGGMGYSFAQPSKPSVSATAVVPPSVRSATAPPRRPSPAVERPTADEEPATSPSVAQQAAARRDSSGASSSSSSGASSAASSSGRPAGGRASGTATGAAARASSSSVAASVVQHSPRCVVVQDPWVRRVKRSAAARSKAARRNEAKLSRRLSAAEAAGDELAAAVVRRLMEKNGAGQQAAAADVDSPAHVAQQVRGYAPAQTCNNAAWNS